MRSWLIVKIYFLQSLVVSASRLDAFEHNFDEINSETKSSLSGSTSDMSMNNDSMYYDIPKRADRQTLDTEGTAKNNFTTRVTLRQRTTETTSTLSHFTTQTGADDHSMSDNTTRDTDRTTYDKKTTTENRPETLSTVRQRTTETTSTPSHFTTQTGADDHSMSDNTTRDTDQTTYDNEATTENRLETLSTEFNHIFPEEALDEEPKSFNGVVQLESSKYGRSSFSLFRKKYRKLCSGSLISSRWILAAASCLYARYDDGNILSFRDPASWRVRLPMENPERNFGDYIIGIFRQKEYKIDAIYDHPKFNKDRFGNDIALFRLSKELTSEYVAILQPMGLPGIVERDFSWPTTKQRCMAVSWGCDRYGQPSLPIQTIDADVWNLDHCSNKHQRDLGLEKDQAFCTRSIYTLRRICDSAEGVPIVCPSIDGTYKLAGFSICRSKDFPMRYPTIFSRIAQFIEWIQETMEIK